MKLIHASLCAVMWVLWKFTIAKDPNRSSFPVSPDFFFIFLRVSFNDMNSRGDILKFQCWNIFISRLVPVPIRPLRSRHGILMCGRRRRAAATRPRGTRPQTSTTRVKSNLSGDRAKVNPTRRAEAVPVVATAKRPPRPRRPSAVRGKTVRWRRAANLRPAGRAKRRRGLIYYILLILKILNKDIIQILKLHILFLKSILYLYLCYW